MFELVNKGLYHSYDRFFHISKGYVIKGFLYKQWLITPVNKAYGHVSVYLK